MEKYQTETDILKKLTSILEDMTSDWELDYSGGIIPDTGLIGDLSFESIEIVQLMVAIEQQFDIKNLTSEKLLMRDGKYVPELTVSEIANFLNEEINK
jgi:acyl carrier protein